MEKVIGSEEKPKLFKVINGRLTIYGEDFVYLALMGIFFAFVGWTAENSAKAITTGIIDSRFHILPFISPYALVPFAAHIAVGDTNNLTFFGHRVFKENNLKNKILSNFLTFLIFVVVVFIGELVVGNLWELLFGAKLWNYSNIPLCVTQYAGLIPSLGYGGGAYLLMKFAYKPLLRQFKKIDFKIAKIIAIVLGTLIILDTLQMMIVTAVRGEGFLLWKIELW